MVGPAQLIRFSKAQPLGCYCGEHFKMLGRKILMTMHPTTCLLYAKGTFLTFVP